jgi:hypothetical protein
MFGCFRNSKKRIERLRGRPAERRQSGKLIVVGASCFCQKVNVIAKYNRAVWAAPNETKAPLSPDATRFPTFD